MTAVASDPLVAQRQLRTAFGRFATGVAVITTQRAGGGWVAVTVNSFASVSLSPPLLLFSLARAAHCLRHFESAQSFAASLLRHDQQSISDTFARPSSSRWDGIARHETADGYLLIENALATFCCVEHARHVAGDHVLFVGRIERFALGPSARPLAYFQGGYGSFTPEQSARLPLPIEGAEVAELGLGWG